MASKTGCVSVGEPLSAKDRRRRGLSLQRFTGFAEQAGVFNCDYRLRREPLNHLDLSFGEWSDGLAAKGKHADGAVIAKQRRSKERPITSFLLRRQKRAFGVGQHVGYLDDPGVHQGSADHAAATRFEPVGFRVVDPVWGKPVVRDVYEGRTILT